MERYICIHGHFYQPPRENPWLDSVEIQDTSNCPLSNSPYPYHDWNEKITEECYAANAVSCLFNGEGRITQLVNNYAKISFDFGPTLLAWLEVNAPDVYESILEGDRESQKRFSGHGSALAQAYNHMILPLANRRDKETQVIWGIRDFEYRFGRKPEGMWLPEMAVNLETLEVLADNGILFTILCPPQAKQIRPIGGNEREWEDVDDARIDPTMPYILNLPSGRSITLFFRDEYISKQVAFDGLLKNSRGFVQGLMAGFSEERNHPQLVNIANDGESYGHHSRYGEIALSYALHHIESEGRARLTNYGEYLDKFPPSHEVKIFENTSWGCVHGIKRWQDDCGCGRTEEHPNQNWRRPLREALDWLRDILTPVYEKRISSFLKDPWKARNDYIQIILDRSSERIENFLSRHARHPLNGNEKIMVLRLLESQRHSMFMYTSCGWYYADIGGIEAIQNIKYAGRALQLSEEIFGDILEPRFLELLELAKSNDDKFKNGREIFEKEVRPDILDLGKVGAHYAITSLFQEYPKRTSIFCYTVTRQDYKRSEVGKAKLVGGRVNIISEITLNSASLTFIVLHQGGLNLYCGVLKDSELKDYQSLLENIFESFKKEDFEKVIRILEHSFGSHLYSLNSLFRDKKRKILNLIMESSLNEAEIVYRQLYDLNAPMIRFFKSSDIPFPQLLHYINTSGSLLISTGLRRVFEQEKLQPDVIESLLKKTELAGNYIDTNSDNATLGLNDYAYLDTDRLKDTFKQTLERMVKYCSLDKPTGFEFLQNLMNDYIYLDTDALKYTLKRSLERMAKRFLDKPTEFEFLQNLVKAVDMLNILPLKVNLKKIQIVLYKIREAVYPEILEKAKGGEESARKWIKQFDYVLNLVSSYFLQEVKTLTD